MICIHEDILTQLDLDRGKIDALAAEFIAHGILPSSAPGFGDAKGPRPRGLPQADWLAAEPKPHRLLLVGIDDRHEVGKKIAGKKNVQIIHLLDGHPATLTEDDRLHLPDVMRPFGWDGVNRALLKFFILSLFREPRP